MSKLETNTIDTVSGTSTLQVGSTNTSTITLGVSGDTINVPSGVTIANSGTATGFGGDNTPYFFAYRSSNTNISASTWTVVVFNAESLDSGSGFNTTTGIYTVPSGQGGKYYLEHEVRIEASTSQVDRIYTYGETGVGTTQYWGNGGLDFRGNPGQGGSVGGSRILTLAAGDTAKVNIYAGLNTGTPTVLGGSEGYTSYFLGYKIIE
jgi:hypothetical protein